MEILRTEGLYRTCNQGQAMEVRALKPLDLSIEQGVFYAIIGRSGSGKSTLLQILGGLDRPTGASFTSRIRVRLTWATASSAACGTFFPSPCCIFPLDLLF